MRRALATTSLTLLVLVAAPAGAFGQGVFKDFQRDGSINPCKYSDGQLRQGAENVPPDLDQYAPGLGDQLRSGRGSCGGGGGSGGGSSQQQSQEQQDQAAAAAGGGKGGGGPNSGKSGTEIAKPPAPPAAPEARLAGAGTPRIAADPSGSNAPGWLFLLAALALAGGLLALVARRRGWSAERFMRPLGAALDEAGGRTADALATTRERLRPRRG